MLSSDLSAAWESVRIFTYLGFRATWLSSKPGMWLLIILQNLLLFPQLFYCHQCTYMVYMVYSPLLNYPGLHCRFSPRPLYYRRPLLVLLFCTLVYIFPSTANVVLSFSLLAEKVLLIVFLTWCTRGLIFQFFISRFQCASGLSWFLH